MTAHKWKSSQFTLGNLMWNRRNRGSEEWFFPLHYLLILWINYAWMRACAALTPRYPDSAFLMLWTLQQNWKITWPIAIRLIAEIDQHFSFLFCFFFRPVYCCCRFVVCERAHRSISIALNKIKHMLKRTDKYLKVKIRWSVRENSPINLCNLVLHLSMR